MIAAIKGLALVLGLVAYAPDHALDASWPEPAPAAAAWYPPTPPGSFTAEQAAVAAPAPEVHHEEDHQAARQAARARLLPLPAIRGAWRAQMAWWLDNEWLAWRELLYTYPMPGEGPCTD